MSKAQTHELKVWSEFFGPILRGDKDFEVRKGEDRQYHVGDWLLLREWNENYSDGYTGQFLYKRIKYVMHGGNWLPPDVWVLGLET